MRGHKYTKFAPDFNACVEPAVIKYRWTAMHKHTLNKVSAEGINDETYVDELRERLKHIKIFTKHHMSNREKS